MLRERDANDPDWPRTRNQHVLGAKVNLLRDVNRVPEGVEQRTQLSVYQIRLDPHVLGWNHHVVGESSVAVHPDPLSAQAHVFATGSTVPAAPAHDVALDRDLLADVKVSGFFPVRHPRAQGDDGSEELVPQSHRGSE